jgi:hypothetical protein
MSAKLFKDILTEAGAVKGVGDYRPEYGRFRVEKCEVVE